MTMENYVGPYYSPIIPEPLLASLPQDLKALTPLQGEL